MKNYNFPKNLKDIFNNFISSYKENKKDKKEQIQFVNGLYGSTFSVFADQLHSQTNHPLLIITSDNENARNIYDDLYYLHGENKVILFPLLEVMTTEPALFHPTILSQFQNSLIKLAEDSNKIVVLPIETAFIKVLDSKELSNEYYTIKTGDEIDRDTMVEFLINFGYSRVDAVEELG
ncbi:MAG: hypothetical protein KAR38_09985, partial [Calditrichia bacterium]|nr:hypothetical protein [Calditrichia bacterium]